MEQDVRVSEIVRDFFEQKGIEHAFLLSGGMMMYLLDSLSKSTKIKYICNHHEQACSIAAEGYARMKESVGLCYATSGPASTNLVTGIAGAYLDSSPIVFITGQSRTELTVRGAKIDNLRTLGNFEVDIVKIVQPITKYAVHVDKATDIAYELEKAYYMAEEGRPGPVLLDIPLDIQGAYVHPSQLRHFEVPQQIPVIDSTSFAILLNKIKSAKRPVIIAGHGIRVSKQAVLFRSLVENSNIPIVNTQLANDLIPFEDKHYIGKVGLRGDRAGNFAVQTADLIISIGTSLHVTTTGYELEDFAPQAYKVDIDIDPAVLKKNERITQLQICADVRVALEQIQKGLAGWKFETDNEWFRTAMEIKSRYPVIGEAHKVEGDDINTYNLIEALSASLNGSEVIVTDSGSLYYIIGQTFKIKEGQRMIISGALGAMGYALPASIGAAFASPDKTVICITGDGSMQANVQELQTISNYQLNCKIIVVNNKGYASIRNSQASFMNGRVAASSEGTGVTFPNWKKLADAYSIGYRTVKLQSGLNEFLSELLSVKGPVLAEVVIPENVFMMPAVTSSKSEKGGFKANRLHEMSPQIADDLLNINKFLDLNYNESSLP